MPSPNQVVTASAGSGKTTYLIRSALGNPKRKTAILTYTNNNLSEISAAFYREAGCVPSHVALYSWYMFLLREGARPYQRALYTDERVESLFFPEGKTQNYQKRENVARYYFVGRRYLVADRASDFVLRCNVETKGLVVSRLEDIFDDIYVDEIQDLAGYDLDFVEALLDSRIAITLVGDVRQATYFTNQSNRNSKFKGKSISGLFQKWSDAGKCEVAHHDWSYRCIQPLCDLADALYPKMPKTTSRNVHVTGHDGVFRIASKDVEAYVNRFHPTVLRYSRKEDCMGLPAVNFGESKGCTYERTLVFPNGPLREMLEAGTFERMKAPAKYYVAFTRARQSLAFVYDGACALAGVNAFQP